MPASSCAPASANGPGIRQDDADLHRLLRERARRPGQAEREPRRLLLFFPTCETPPCCAARGRRCCRLHGTLNVYRCWTASQGVAPNWPIRRGLCSAEPATTSAASRQATARCRLPDGLAAAHRRDASLRGLRRHLTRSRRAIVYSLHSTGADRMSRVTAFPADGRRATEGQSQTMQGAAVDPRADPRRRARARKAHFRAVGRRAHRHLAHADPRRAAAAGGGRAGRDHPVRRLCGKVLLAAGRLRRHRDPRRAGGAGGAAGGGARLARQARAAQGLPRGTRRGWSTRRSPPRTVSPAMSPPMPGCTR